jgi:site-specific recombinase XerD
MTTDIMLSLPQIFDTSFINQVFSNCDISEKTRQDYRMRINRFREFVQNNGGLDRNTLLQFKRFLANNNQISVATKNKHFTVAVVFLKQLFRLGVLKFDLGQGVRGFRVGSSFKTNGFTPDEVKRIVAGLNDSKSIKVKALVILKWQAGLRDIELVRLMVEDVNLSDGFINIHGKGRDGKESLPVVPQVIQVLREYLQITGKRSGHLFTSYSKRNRGQQITTKTVWLCVRGFLNDLGISRKPHTFRSLFTTTLCEKMPNLFDVINFTRHKSIQTLQSYVNQIQKCRAVPVFRAAFDEYVISKD